MGAGHGAIQAAAVAAVMAGGLLQQRDASARQNSAALQLARQRDALEAHSRTVSSAALCGQAVAAAALASNSHAVEIARVAAAAARSRYEAALET
eukprot:scaffold39516_cov75-Phaeocystis_antarctica.AAC.1